MFRLAVYDAAGVIEPWRYLSTTNKQRRAWARRDDDGNAVTKERLQREAYAWLSTPSEGLAFWCDALDIEMEVMMDGADAAVERAKRMGKVGRLR